MLNKDVALIKSKIGELKVDPKDYRFVRLIDNEQALLHQEVVKMEERRDNKIKANIRANTEVKAK
jgi:hypothetical protein